MYGFLGRVMNIFGVYSIALQKNLGSSQGRSQKFLHRGLIQSIDIKKIIHKSIEYGISILIYLKH